jgi:hypothetical protein
MIPTILGKEPSAATLRQLTDAEIMLIVEAPLRSGPAGGLEVEATKARVQLRSCVVCHAQEDALGIFKKCRACETIYCGKECQKNDWKTHKKVCSKKA